MNIKSKNVAAEIAERMQARAKRNLRWAIAKGIALVLITVLGLGALFWMGVNAGKQCKLQFGEGWEYFYSKSSFNVCVGPTGDIKVRR